MGFEASRLPREWRFDASRLPREWWFEACRLPPMGFDASRPAFAPPVVLSRVNEAVSRGVRAGEYGVALQSRMDVRVEPRLALKFLKLRAVEASDELS